MYSHTITEDTTWYYRQLTTEPSLIVEIQFSVVSIETPHTIRLNFYTTEDNINLQENCSFQNNGQLLNGYLWVPLKSTNNDCLKDKNGLLHCAGKTVIQDFKPRRISFSFGNACKFPTEMSLKGLSFNISVSDQKNKSECVPVQNRRNLKDCGKFYPFASFPNLLGEQLQEAIDTAGSLFSVFKQIPGGCYKFLLEIFCYIFGPKCDATRRVTIPPCKETCWDFLNGCQRKYRKLFTYKKTDITDFLNCDYLPTVGSDIKCFYKAVTCGLPPKIPHGRIEDGVISNGTYPLHTELSFKCVNETFVIKGNSTITCMYTGTWSQPPQCALRTCPEPPIVEHAHIEEHQNVSEVYPWHTQVTYVCDNNTFHMEGNSTITCLKNEHWSPAPECVELVPDIINQNKLKTLEIVLPIVFVALLVLTSSCLVIFYKRKLRLKGNSLLDAFTLDNVDLTRMKKYDAFVCYQFDSDDDFVKNTIIPELEEKHDPPFKLCVHENDFELGKKIFHNMQAAIENSNSAILVMSQGFLDSDWCPQEFEYCHIEHMKDPAFKLFIILMQPVASLKNLTECMKQYFVQETYAKKDDEKLFIKIASYLTLLKQPKDDEDAPEGIEVNPDEEQEGQSHQENEEGITTDVPADDAQNDTDVNNDHSNFGFTVDGHEDISNEAENEIDVHVIVHNGDDVSGNDENVPLLFN